MAPVDRAAQMKAALANKVQESHLQRDNSGQFKSIFVESSDLKFWKCATGEHLVDIIPYIAGGADPDGKIKKGDITYVLVIWVHYAVGVNQDAYVCPARNYSQACPICEYREELRKQDDYDEDLVKSMNPKRRAIYNVVVYDNDKETAKGIQIFDVAHWFMERHLSGLAKMPAVGPGGQVSYIPFADLQDGKIVAFERVGVRQNSDFISHRFLDRNYKLPLDMVDQAYSLDQWIIQSSYEEIKNAFYGGEGTETAPPEEAPIAETAAPAPPAIAPSLKTRRAPIETPAPTPTPVPTPKAPAPVASSNTCPAGGEFGMCEQYEQCAGCPEWNPCSAEADKRAVQAASTPVPTPRVPTPVAAPRPAVPTPRPSPVAAPRPTPAPTAGAPAAGPRRMPPRR